MLEEKRKVLKAGTIWTAFSPFTVRHNEVGSCAEENGGTNRCIPGMCELCGHCSSNPKNKEAFIPLSRGFGIIL
ncbi:MAG: hypothetical protein WC682_02515 [Parcubacteria group bacterium]|jgi:hypothetical protein